MEFKLAEAVKYKGGIVNFGLKYPRPFGEEPKDTDEYIEILMSPVTKTYIWKVIPVPKKGNIYIIQHVDGVDTSFFIKQKEYFGEDTNWNFLSKQTQKNPITKLEETMKFIYVFEEDLESLDKPITASEKIIPEQEAKTSSTLSKEVKNEIFEDEEFDVDIQFKKNLQEFKQELPANLSNNESEGLNHPYFTSQTCPIDMMVECMPKQKTLFYRKMAEPFSVEFASGQKGKGRGGDYLMKNTNGNVFIEPKETFDLMYQEKTNTRLKKIGKDQIEYQLDLEVLEYLNFLEEENKKFRVEKFL